MSIFKGAGVAIVTPMKENEEVNYEKLQELIEWQIDQGTDAIIIAGTTGESSTLTMEEHSKVIKAAVEFAKHRVPVVAGSGSNCTREAIYLTQEAEEAGADGILAVTPYIINVHRAVWYVIILKLQSVQSYRSSCIMYLEEPDAIFFRRQQQRFLRKLKM